MVRSIPAAAADQINSGAAHPVVLARLDLPGETVRVHSGSGTLDWDGHEWLGVGGYGFVRLPPYGAGFAQQKGSVSIGGLPGVVDALLSIAVSGSWVEIWWGCLTGRTPAPLVSDPVREFAGFIDGSEDEITDGEQRATMGLKIGPSQTTRGSSAHTYEDQRTRHPDDTAGRFVKAAVAESIARANKW